MEQDSYQTEAGASEETKISRISLKKGSEIEEGSSKIEKRENLVDALKEKLVDVEDTPRFYMTAPSE